MRLEYALLYLDSPEQNAFGDIAKWKQTEETLQTGQLHYDRLTTFPLTDSGHKMSSDPVVSG